MKNRRGLIIASVVCLAMSTSALGAEKASKAGASPMDAEKVSSVLAPFSGERIAILTGEKALAAVGQKDGVVKGDVGFIAADPGEAAKDSSIGQCAVVRAGAASS